MAMMVGGCAAATAPGTPAQTTPEAPAPVPIEGDGPCNADKLQSMVGQPLTDELRKGMLGGSGAKTLRVIPPGAAVTMDYREDRLNIETDAAGMIIGVKCG